GQAPRYGVGRTGQRDMTGCRRIRSTADQARRLAGGRSAGPPRGDLPAMAAYVRQYGVLAEGTLRGWQEADGAAEIIRQEFESTWAAARETLDADRTEETT